MTKKALARPVWIAAVGGFLAGALAVSMIVWQFGNVIGSREARQRHPAEPAAAIDRWGTDLDGGTVAVIEHPPSAATSGETGAAGFGAAIPSIGANPISVLRDRKLMLPVPGVERDQLHGSFSERRGSTRRHEAIDILAPRNTPVVAVEDGRIARLFLSRDGGITVYQFDPGEQYVYYYAHLERYADGLREGDRVKKGQVIGYVGTSGNAPPGTPHLHFAIFKLTEEKKWWEGAPLDPFEVLR
jgi:murein DD-endopeptidase MepM/ murein hydrolase activator NlpD